MGLLINGQWHDGAQGTTQGRFVRKESVFRNWVTPSGEPGPGGQGGFAAEPDRYHLYISLACPWAHRTMMMRSLKGIQPIVGVSVVNWLMLDKGWTFNPGPGVVGDPIGNAQLLSEIYLGADPTYTGRVTVPVLWDRKKSTIVSNESSDIMRMFNSAFDGVGANAMDLYPSELRPEIDAISARLNHSLNNGVYKAGFATSQDAYEEAVYALFETLDWLEEKLGSRRYLVDDRLTEADIRLFVTLVRFDAVYHSHFKCNMRRIQDYPNLSNYGHYIYHLPGIPDTVNFEHIKRHYYESHPLLSPGRIVPLGPELGFAPQHARAGLN